MSRGKREGLTVKINQVEERVGITKRNIRYYEKEGLLSPGRNSENGYREYGEDEVTELKKIKLLRKLDVPLEEIRRMQGGTLTLADGLRRHLITLERQQSNLATMEAMCRELLETGERLDALDADRYLSNMEQMEKEGTRFVNIQKRDRKNPYVGPIVAVAVFIAAMAGIMALFLWAFLTAPEESPPAPLVILITALPAVCIVGAVVALVQRVKQIRGGEEDAASQY